MHAEFGGGYVLIQSDYTAAEAVACFRNGIGTIIRENENGVKSQNVFHSRLRGERMDSCENSWHCRGRTERKRKGGKPHKFKALPQEQKVSLLPPDMRCIAQEALFLLFQREKVAPIISPFPERKKKNWLFFYL